MNAHLASATAVARKEARNQRLGALGGLALALALAAGIGAWRVAGQGDAVSSPPAATSRAPQADRSPVTVRSGEPPIVYIVHSEEDAELIRRFATELDGSWATPGQHPNASLLVTDFDAATVAAVLPGASGQSFIDLRIP